MFSAAPVPRPPQPTRPTLIVSLPAAWALVSRPRPAAAAVELFKKSRREAEDAFEGDGSVMVVAPGLGNGSTSTLAFNHLRLEALEVLLLLQRPDDAETDEGGIGVPPDALGPLRVLGAPLRCRAFPRGTAEQLRVVVPRAAPHDVGILLGIRQDDRAEGRLVPGVLLVGVLEVVVQAP